MSIPQSLIRFLPALHRGPGAQADLSGDRDRPDLQGLVQFYSTRQGVLVLIEVSGLPVRGGRCENGFFPIHIHSGGACTGTPSDPFADAQGHYDSEGCPHPAHAGDLPPLLADENGYALQAVLTDRFGLDEVIGRTVILHGGVDDFTSQPAGNAGERIACGVIRRIGWM